MSADTKQIKTQATRREAVIRRTDLVIICYKYIIYGVFGFQNVLIFFGTEKTVDVFRADFLSFYFFPTDSFLPPIALCVLLLHDERDDCNNDRTNHEQVGRETKCRVIAFA